MTQSAIHRELLTEERRADVAGKLFGTLEFAFKVEPTIFNMAGMLATALWPRPRHAPPRVPQRPQQRNSATAQRQGSQPPVGTLRRCGSCGNFRWAPGATRRPARFARRPGASTTA